MATGAPVDLAAVTPSYFSAGSTATITLTGAGFDQATSVALIPAVGPSTKYTPTNVSLDSFTQLTATFNLSLVPEGLYSVIVTRADGTSSELTAAFTVTSPAAGHLVTQLILPSAMGRHISSTIYVEYSNTGGQALPAPLSGAVRTTGDRRRPNDHQPAVTHAQSRAPGFGLLDFGCACRLLANRSDPRDRYGGPGLARAGRIDHRPGLLRRDGAALELQRAELRLCLAGLRTGDRTTLNWSSLQSSLQPSGMPTAAWDAIYAGLTSQIGDTWGDYVQMLDDNAAYLGQLGEDVIDVNQLWQFAIMQANGLSPVPVLADDVDVDVSAAGMASTSPVSSPTRSSRAIHSAHSATDGRTTGNTP